MEGYGGSDTSDGAAFFTTDASGRPKIIQGYAEHGGTALKDAQRSGRSNGQMHREVWTLPPHRANVQGVTARSLTPTLKNRPAGWTKPPPLDRDSRDSQEEELRSGVQRSLTPPPAWLSSKRSRTPRSGSGGYNEQSPGNSSARSVANSARRGSQDWTFNGDYEGKRYAGKNSHEVNNQGETLMTSSSPTGGIRSFHSEMQRSQSEKGARPTAREARNERSHRMGAGLLGDEIGHRCLATGKQKSHMRVANTSSAEIAATFGKIQDETAPKPKKSEKFGDYAGQVPAQRVAGPKTPRKDTTGPMAPFPQQLTGPEVCGINSIAHKRGARQSRAGQSIVQTVVFKHPKHEGMVDNLKTIEPYMGAAGYCPGMEPSKTGPKYFPCKRVPYDIGNFPDEEARILENQAIEQGENSMEQRQEEMKLGQVVTRRKSDLTRYAGVNLPTIFVSVGPGSMILNWDSHLPVMKNMANIFKICGVKRDMIRCVVVISCNWTQARPGFDVDIGLTKKPQRLLTDYSGAPAGNYIVNEYCPFGHPDVSQRVEELLRKANFTTSLEKDRYLDSAAWLPLSLMPDAWDIPVVQISLPGVRKTGEDLDGSMIAKKALEMGYALRELRREGVLLLGCGHIYKGDALGAAESGLDKWVGGVKKACVQAPPNNRAGLLEQFSKIPYARRAASTDVSSLLPLHVVAGAGHGEPGQCMGDFRVGKGAMVHFKFGHDLYVEASK